MSNSLLAQSQPLGGTIQGAGKIGEETTAALGSPGAVTALFERQLSNIIGFITILGGLFFLIYFLIAAFEWLRSGTDKGGADKAKNRMTNAAIGLLIMVISLGIAGIVGGVFGIDILNIGTVFQTLIP